jgi:hypothetical protein
MATLEAIFFVFLFHPFFHFHLFIMNVTRALSLETLKGEAGATSRDDGEDEETTHNTHTPR